MDIIARFGARHRKGAIGVAASMAILMVQAAAWAADGAAAAAYPVHQPAQSLSEALRAIGRQTSSSVIFDAAVVGQRVAPAISGQMTAAEALATVLDGTGLIAEQGPSGGWIVRARRPGEPAMPGARSSSAGAATQMSRVEVTGSRLKRIEAEGPLPVNVYRREDIERSGQSTLSEFIRTLNETSMNTGEGTYGGTANQGTVQLRGLPLGATLVLVNGRRVQAVGASSGNFFNLNLIPMAAVERVEIVPVGSSAIYGGDALAGVVNVILKKSMDGFNLDTRVSSGAGFESGGVSLATGAKGEHGSYLLLGSLSKSTPLTMSERDFFRDADYRRFGGVDARTTLCSPGTVTSNTTANLPGLNARTAVLPTLAAGQPLTIASLAATAGQTNLCGELDGYGYSLASAKRTAAFHAAGEREVADGWTLFGELTYTDEISRTPQAGFALSNILVPATNAYNPFGTAVRITTMLSPENGDRGQRLSVRYSRALGGVRAELGAGWDAEVSFSTSRDQSEGLTSAGSVDATARTTALASSNPATALNPFTTGRAASEDVIRAVWPDSIRTSVGQRDQLSGFARGKLADLPAGPVDAIVGAEALRDLYYTAFSGQVRDTQRQLQAVYGELRAPLLRGDGPAGRGGDLAALTLASRGDRYSDFGSATTYQTGLELRPTRSILLRGSAATSFKPPTLLQSNTSLTEYTTEFYSLVDPKRGGAPIVGGIVARTKNPDLTPEKGKAFALGAAFEPEAGTRLAVTAWRIKINNLIGLLAPQVVLNNEALFPQQVIRAPSAGGVPGVVTRVLYQETNFGSLQADGLDLDASISWISSIGRWSAGASATKTRRYDVAITPGTPTVSRLGRRFSDYWAPEWKGRLSLGLEGRGWSVGASARYLGSYLDTGTSDRKLGDYAVLDLSGRLDLTKLGFHFGPVKAAVVTAGILNVGNRLPTYASGVPYYDPTQSDWRGRTLNARLSLDW